MSANGMALDSFGPLDRVSFHDEQARRRRGTWRMALACLLIAAAMGIVTAAIAGPAVILIAGGLLHLAAWAGIEPAYCLQTAAALGRWAGSKMDLLQRDHRRSGRQGRLAQLLGGDPADAGTPDCLRAGADRIQ